MPDYSQAKIYRLISPSTGKVYYGSTVKPKLEYRLGVHLNHYKYYRKGEWYYLSSFDVLCEDDCEIELVEYYPCSNKKELREREDYYIRSNECVNSVRATQKVDNPSRKKKENKKEYNREYHREYFKKGGRYYGELRPDLLKNVRCKICDSIIQKRSWNRHCISAKHREGKEEMRKTMEIPDEYEEWNYEIAILRKMKY